MGPFQELPENRGTGTYTVIQNTAASGTVASSINTTITATSSRNVAESFLAFSTTKPSAYTLNSAVTSSATAFTVTTGTLVTGYYQFNNEVVHITAVSSNTIASTVVRAQNGSSAQTANTSDTITFGNIPGAGASNPSNGDMFAHAGFAPLALNTNDSVNFQWVVSITS